MDQWINQTLRKDEKGVSQVTTEAYLLSSFHWVLFHPACPLTHSQGKLLAHPAEADHTGLAA